jgi:hypothetical protein
MTNTSWLGKGTYEGEGKDQKHKHIGTRREKHQWKETIKNINTIYIRINKNSCDQRKERKHLQHNIWRFKHE